MRRSPSASRRHADISVENDIPGLRSLDSTGLRARWRSVTGREAPGHLPRHLLFAMLAYRIQADAIGDLDGQTVRLLKKVGESSSSSDVLSLTAASDQRRGAPPLGTVLSREWGGHVHQVMVVRGGFAWDGKVYKSLSKIACAITGTRWNGPRFFGLRDANRAES